MGMSEKKVVIIGAGPAGLSAAYELLKKSDIKPIVLETEQFVGGISRTVEYKGNRMDIGGHRFFTKCNRVNELWEELMPVQGAPAYDDIVLNNEKDYKKGGPDPKKEDKVMLIRRRVSRIYFLRKFFDYPITMKPRTFINMGFCRTMKAGFGYLKSCFRKLPEDSLENFYINRFGKPLYQMFFEDYTTKVWGVSPKTLSASWGAQRVKGLSLRKAIKEAIAAPFRKKQREIETSLINQFHYPKKGPGQLFSIMAEEIEKMGGQVLYGQEVNKIERDERNNIVAVTTKKGDCFPCDTVFSTMPIKDFFTSLGKDNVPPREYEIATTLPYRDFITVGLLLKGLKVKNKTKIRTLNNIVPDNWIYVQERSVEMGRIQIFNNWSPYMVEDPEHHVWIGLEYFCNEGDEMWNSSDRDFIDKAIEELVSMDIIASKEDVLDSCRIKVKKAYPAYYGSYDDFPIIEKYLNDIPNLYCIGRNGQHRYNNMDHSMLSALTAVDHYLSGTNDDKSAIWKVNTEKSYHEGNDENEKEGSKKQ
ncbi:MAG TPA: NAD(P)/FAD-dependent oxidoreductase [Erysipelotrichaceae bacterium]|nr:NAD(P)/FAD-dependent oxidoreductase [Erysipelotrichaceae bacterium]